MTSTAFLESYPEFRNVAIERVLSALADAAGDLDVSVWGADYDRGHGLRAAAILALGPAGAPARLQSDKGKATYQAQFRELQVKVGCGIRVV